MRCRDLFEICSSLSTLIEETGVLLIPALVRCSILNHLANRTTLPAPVRLFPISLFIQPSQALILSSQRFTSNLSNTLMKHPPPSLLPFLHSLLLRLYLQIQISLTLVGFFYKFFNFLHLDVIKLLSKDNHNN